MTTTEQIEAWIDTLRVNNATISTSPTHQRNLIMPTVAPNPTSDLDWALRNIGEQLVAVTRANPALLDDLPLNVADAVTYARTLTMLGAA